MNRFLLFVVLLIYSHLSASDRETDSLIRRGYSDTNLNTAVEAHPDLEDTFTYENMARWYPVSDSVKNMRGQAQKSFGIIKEKGAWLTTFSGDDITQLPIGLKQTIGNIEYAIGIVSAEVKSEYTELTVFGRVKLPQTNANGYPIELFFGAEGIKLSHQGGLIGDTKLVLLGDMHIAFNAGNWMLTLKGGLDIQSGNIHDKTYVTITCDGIKEMGVQGAVEFSRKLILPVAYDGSVVENTPSASGAPERVRGDFNIIVSNWNDILAEVSLQPFVLARKRNKENYSGNFQFIVNQAVLDFSDLRNSPSVKFPDYYRENGLLLPSEQSWRGVYVNTLEVRLPEEFKTKESISNGRRISFGAHHLLIDGQGVSGVFYADNLFPLNSGRTNSGKAWAYSLDHLEISLAANNLTGAEFEGRILLPVSKETEADASENIGLKYTGLISENEYLINVKTGSVVNFDLWSAKATLLPNSSIELRVREGEFRPKAVLHGSLSIKADKKPDEKDLAKKENTLVDFEEITFRNLVLKTDAPLFSVDYMGYSGELKLANFPVTISRIGITSNAQNASLHFDLNINLTGEKNALTAKTGLTIVGSFEELEYRQYWKFQGVDLSTIAIKGNMGAFAMEGQLELMEDDPEYGNGFYAALKVQFNGIAGLTIDAKGIFGKKEFRYWQFDALVGNLPFVGGGLNFEGFAGGASYHMRRTGFFSDFSPSGISYEPDANLGVGVKAMVLFSAVNKSIIKGGAGFEILFNGNGGINQIGLYGQATFLGVSIPGMESINDLVNTVKKNALVRKKFIEISGKGAHIDYLKKAEKDFPMTPPQNMVISAKAGITYDFQNDVLHGELEAYINTPGGFLKGRGAQGRAGWAVLHFASDSWYIYIGTPEDRLGLTLGIGPVHLETGGYFMVGSVLPGSPPPPPIVAEILGTDVESLNYMRDENALSSGGGFAFGTDFSLDTGDLTFLIFYARFQAGIGFDIMLRNYGEAACANTGRQVGINGWYANGQAYAYLQGELGIRIKLFFIKKRIPIIKGGAAVLLQAKAPNPFWMRGYVGGHFNLLGGLVKGRFRFKLTVGEECEFTEASPLGGIKIIADLAPDGGGNAIDVFTIPQATFSLKVGTPVVIPEDEGDKTYKVVLEEFKVLQNGNEIQGTVEWNRSRDRASFVSTDILPPNKQLKVRVSVSFQEKVNGIFRPVTVNGKRAEETEERSFTTGGAPDKIPLQNIVHAYPVLDQKYFYEDEYKKGYIQLKRGQDYLFDVPGWNTFIAYSDASGNQLQADFGYDATANRINYDMPDLEQRTSYHLFITSRPEGAVGKSPVKETYKNIDTGQVSKDNQVSVRTKKSEQLSKDEGIERLAYDFSTSKYKTFQEKIKSIKVSDYNWRKIYSDVISLSSRIAYHEPFDLVELEGSTYTGQSPLVHAEALLSDAYFTKDINPPLYARYPLGGRYKITSRNEDEEGVPPVRALPVMQNYLTSLEYDVNENMLKTTFPYRYNLPWIYKADWVDLQYQIVNDLIDGKLSKEDPVTDFLDTNYLFIRYGFYKIKLSYVLPGDIKGSSSEFSFKNPNKFR